MLSILIPTFNRKCYTLAADLQHQCDDLHLSYEIIVAEDGGKDQVVSIANHRINELPGCRYIRRSENVGRSAIRNFLADEAQGDWLLFMDSDGRIVRNDFIGKYLQAASEQHVVCGGIIQPEACPSHQQSLRWRYEKDYEERVGCISTQFRSFCFLIHRDSFHKVRFDERFRMYGWEDVQFGIDLKRHGIGIIGIDNPLLNDDIETNSQFLRKTEEAITSLSQFEEQLCGHVHLLDIKQRLCRLHLWWLLRAIFPLLRRPLTSHLLGSHPDLKAFGLYRLGYLASLPTSKTPHRP